MCLGKIFFNNYSHTVYFSFNFVSRALACCICRSNNAKKIVQSDRFFVKNFKSMLIFFLKFKIKVNISICFVYIYEGLLWLSSIAESKSDITTSAHSCDAHGWGQSTYMPKVSSLRAVITVGRFPAGLWITGLVERSRSGLQRNKQSKGRMITKLPK